jgi:hypothetical protein
MDSTFPQDLLDLKIRVDHWRTTRRFIREALPTELRQAVTECLSCHPVRLIKKALNLDPYRFRMTTSPPVSVRPRDRQRIDFVALPHPSVPASVEPVRADLCQIRIDRRDGSNILITVPPSSVDIIKLICAEFLSGVSQ